ncbi:MAG: hypothetical protein KGD68_14825 [Candidatus Lokiarchaeota archaeon]|nr:hypothetical protein [Candidatus Lokiarchaeota archaeon]
MDKSVSGNTANNNSHGICL